MAKKIAEKKTKVSSVTDARGAEEVTPPAAQEPVEVVSKEPKISKEETTAKAYARALMEEMMPAFLAVAKAQGGSAGAKEGTEAAEARIKRWQICNDCRQKGPKKPPCNGEHTQMIVYPNNPRFGPWFPGSIINGVRYLSGNRRQKVLVPTACVSTIMKQIQDFEENEMSAMMGGRSAEHDSGEMQEGGGGKQRQAVGAGWR